MSLNLLLRFTRVSLLFVHLHLEFLNEKTRQTSHNLKTITKKHCTSPKNLLLEKHRVMQGTVVLSPSKQVRYLCAFALAPEALFSGTISEIYLWLTDLEEEYDPTNPRDH
jgi:hypothetical protein